MIGDEQLWLNGSSRYHEPVTLFLTIPMQDTLNLSPYSSPYSKAITDQRPMNLSPYRGS